MVPIELELCHLCVPLRRCPFAAMHWHESPMFAHASLCWEFCLFGCRKGGMHLPQHLQPYMMGEKVEAEKLLQSAMRR